MKDKYINHGKKSFQKIYQKFQRSCDREKLLDIFVEHDFELFILFIFMFKSYRLLRRSFRYFEHLDFKGNVKNRDEGLINFLD